MKSIDYNKWFFILLAIGLSIWPALYSGFPLVTPDSGIYINSGLRLSVPIDRPIGYGMFILLSSMHASLWLVVFAQGIIFTLLIRWLCKKIFGEKMKESHLALIIALISLGTSVAWFNAQLMADAFSGMLLIALILLYLERANKKKIISLSLIILFFLLVHVSHILIVVAFSLIVGIYAFRKKQKHIIPLSLRLIVISVFAILIISTLNLVKFNTFSMSPVSHMFMMSRMVEEGLVDKYLERNCPNEHLSLCDYQGRLGIRQWNFMWSKDLPHNKENGWMVTKKEYNSIVYGILKSPSLLGIYCLKTVEGTIRQLTQVYVGDGLSPQKKESEPYLAIEKQLSHHLNEYESSLQMSEDLPFNSANIIAITFSILVCLVTIFLWNSPNASYHNPALISQVDWRNIFQMVILFLLLNAFVTATFSTVIARLQSRVFWVLPTVSILWILNYYWQNAKVKEV